MSLSCFKVIYETAYNLNRDLYLKYLTKYENEKGVIYITEELKDEVLKETDEGDKEDLNRWFDNIDMNMDYVFV